MNSTVNEIHSSAIIYPGVSIGEGTRVMAYAVIGSPPEHRDHWNGHGAGVVIGKNCFIGVGATIDSGTAMPTTLNDNVIVLNKAHVSHDALVMDNATIAGLSALCGFAIVEPWAYVGAGAIVHQNSILSAYSILSCNSYLKGKSCVARKLHGHPAKPLGINRLGLARAGISYEDAIKKWGE